MPLPDSLYYKIQLTNNDCSFILVYLKINNSFGKFVTQVADGFTCLYREHTCYTKRILRIRALAHKSWTFRW